MKAVPAIYQKLGVRPIIHGCATTARYGGSILRPEALEAMREASEGMGSKHYVDAQRRLVDLGVDGFAASIEHKPHADIDEWQTQMQLKPMRVGRVRLYTDGLDAITALTGVERVTDLAGAVADGMVRHRDPHVAFVPEGSYVVPIHEGV
jgi:hypothetical protein